MEGLQPIEDLEGFDDLVDIANERAAMLQDAEDDAMPLRPSRHIVLPDPPVINGPRPAAAMPRPARRAAARMQVEDDDEDDDLIAMDRGARPARLERPPVEALERRRAAERRFVELMHDEDDDDDDDDDGLEFFGLPPAAPARQPQRPPFQMAERFERRRVLERRRQDILNRAGLLLPARHGNNNINNNNNPNQNIPSTLYQLVQNDFPCSAANIRGCQQVVDMAAARPELLNYQNATTQDTPLHAACRMGCCTHILRALCTPELQAQANTDDDTPLHLLCSGRRPVNMTMVNIVCTDQIKVMTNRQRCWPLHNAALNPLVPPDVLQHLLVNAAVPTDAPSPLANYCQRRHANIPVVRMLHQVYPDMSRGNAAHVAARSSPAVTNVLVDLHPPVATVVNDQGKCLLHIVCELHTSERDGWASLLEKLVHLAPQVCQMVDRDLLTPLAHLCLHRAPLSSIERVVQANPAALRIANRQGLVPIHHVCNQQTNPPSPELVRLLATCLHDGVGPVTRTQDTVLHLACARQTRLTVISQLLSLYPRAVRIRNNYGNVPLHAACRAHPACGKIVQALLNAWPEGAHMRTHSGESPLDICQANHAAVGVLSLLEEQSAAIPSRPLAAATAAATTTPLHTACFRGTLSVIEQCMTSHPEWIACKNPSGLTALQILCQEGRLGP